MVVLAVNSGYAHAHYSNAACVIVCIPEQIRTMRSIYSERHLVAGPGGW